MKRLTSVAIVISIILLCIPLACSSTENEPPNAYIDSISPSPAAEGEAVTFNSHGTDTDGNVVAYKWESSIDAIIGTTAVFTTSALSVGTHTISFKVQDNNDVWSYELTAQLVVEEKTSMEDAIDVVVEEILPDIPEVKAGSPYVCLKLDAIVPEGTVIKEDSGQTLSITLQEDMYFFYLDLEPGAFYEHGVQYILVDEDGNHNEYEAKWWPSINDSVPEGLVKTIPDDNDIVASNVEFTQATGLVPSYNFANLIEIHGEGFIVVQGLMPDEPLYDCIRDDYWNRRDFFTAYASPYSEVSCLTEYQAPSVLNFIEYLAEDGLNPITISVVAHGGDNCIRLGGEIVTAAQFRDKMAEYPDVTFNFMLTSCHSGSFIDELETLNNVCVVSTASRADESAWPDWDVAYTLLLDHNPSDIGAEWTSSIVEAMSQIIEDTAKFKLIKAIAQEYSVSQTSVLICEGHYGALGTLPEWGLSQDLDLCHYTGFESPQLYCSWETPS